MFETPVRLLQNCQDWRYALHYFDMVSLEKNMFFHMNLPAANVQINDEIWWNLVRAASPCLDIVKFEATVVQNDKKARSTFFERPNASKAPSVDGAFFNSSL